MNKYSLLKELMSIDFTIIDLHLYLDTHPMDQTALNMYNNYVEKAKALRSEYERKYGPITAHHGISGYPWQWIDEPWPWQREMSM